METTEPKLTTPLIIQGTLKMEIYNIKTTPIFKKKFEFSTLLIHLFKIPMGSNDMSKAKCSLEPKGQKSGWKSKKNFQSA